MSFHHRAFEIFSEIRHEAEKEATAIYFKMLNENKSENNVDIDEIVDKIVTEKFENLDGEKRRIIDSL